MAPAAINCPRAMFRYKPENPRFFAHSRPEVVVLHTGAFQSGRLPPPGGRRNDSRREKNKEREEILKSFPSTDTKES